MWEKAWKPAWTRLSDSQVAPAADPLNISFTREAAAFTISNNVTRAAAAPASGDYHRAFIDRVVVDSVYLELLCIAVSGSNGDLSLADDDPPLSATASTRPGDSTPGWTWRSAGSGFGCTPPGAFAAGDILRAKMTVSTRTVALALNDGSFAADATWSAASGDVDWRPLVACFNGSSATFQTYATPIFATPEGFTWIGDLAVS